MKGRSQHQEERILLSPAQDRFDDRIEAPGRPR
jgi:hypothetical protein